MYLDPLAKPSDTLKSIADGAYTIETEEKAAKALYADHYGSKKVFALTSAVLFVALSIILGLTVHPYAYAVGSGIIVSCGIWLFFRSKHQDLETIHNIEYQKVIKIIDKVSENLEELRNRKIQYLMNITYVISVTYEEHENDWDREHSYHEIAKLAEKAKETILQHYKIKPDFSDRLNNFIMKCGDVCGSSVGATVLVKDSDTNRLVKKKSYLSSTCFRLGTKKHCFKSISVDTKGLYGKLIICI